VAARKSWKGWQMNNPSFNFNTANQQLVGQLINVVEMILNRVFEITRQAAIRRRMVVIAISFIIWTVLVLLRVDNVLSLLANHKEGFLVTFLKFGTYYFDPTVLRGVLALFAAFWLAYLIAGMYPADIFDKSIKLGRQFLMQAAFASRYHSITVSAGKIAPEDVDSPLLLIGGPGWLKVELDSAVLVEGPYGPRVIGPSGQDKDDKILLQGHERIRQCIDLRDVADQQTEYLRSRDGILIIARDIQYVYSVNRGGIQPSHLRPYPFDEKAVKNQIYLQGRNPNKPSPDPDWAKSLPIKIIVPISRQIGGFTTSRNLSEILANIGQPELDNLHKREEDIHEQTERTVGSDEENPGLGFDPGTFQPRNIITNLYSSPIFKKVEVDKGFQVRWIGIGTWDLPNEIISQKHLQAWNISRENAVRSDEQELKLIEEESTHQELLRFIQEPLAAFRKSVLANEEDEDVCSALGSQYFERLISALDLYKRDDKVPPPLLLKAILQLKVYQGITSLSKKLIEDYYEKLHEDLHKATEKGLSATPDLIENCWYMSDILEIQNQLKLELDSYFGKLLSKLSDLMHSGQIASVNFINTIWALKIILNAPNHVDEFLKSYNESLRERLNQFSQLGQVPPRNLWDVVTLLNKLLGYPPHEAGEK
jgi:hypothetical protein